MRADQLRLRGHTYYRINQALAKGIVVRPRLGWLALPSAPPELLWAAQHNVVLTCATRAAQLGLWTLQADQPHVSVRHRKSQRPTIDGVVHWRRALVPRPPHMLADHLENALDCVASCLPHEEALAIWDSALQKPLIDLPSLAAIPFKGRARAVLAECTPFSDSGLESIFRTRLRWLRVRIRPQAWVHGHRVDFLIGERLVIQIDGKHHEKAQRASDRAHDVELMKRGYYVIRLGNAEVVFDWSSVETSILDVIARGLHQAR